MTALLSNFASSSWRVYIICRASPLTHIIIVHVHETSHRVVVDVHSKSSHEVLKLRRRYVTPVKTSAARA